MKEPKYGCKDMAFGFVKYPFVTNANKKIKADKDRWDNSYPLWIACCVILPFGWLFRGRNWPKCEKNSVRRKWERSQPYSGPPAREQTRYPETSISPCSLRPRKADDNISNLELDRSKGLDASILKRLPLEIRQEIYGYVLGRQENCLIMLPFKIRAAVEGNNISSALNVSMGGTNQYIFLDDENRFWPQRPALLRTCRQVYTEAVALLYSDNAFVFRHPEVLWRFSRSIPSQRWNCIRSIHVKLVYLGAKLAYSQVSNRQEQWKIMWASVAAMRNLIDLSVEIFDAVEVARWEFVDDLVQMMLTPLLQVRGLHRFQLALFTEGRGNIDPGSGSVPLSSETRALIRLIEDTVKLPKEACICCGFES